MSSHLFLKNHGAMAKVLEGVNTMKKYYAIPCHCNNICTLIILKNKLTITCIFVTLSYLQRMACTSDVTETKQIQFQLVT